MKKPELSAAQLLSLWDDNRTFGDLELASRRVLQQLSFAGQEAAGNLLDKAAKALALGDMERAQTLAWRAAGLPRDRHEDAAPAAMAVHMRLFDLVTDDVEASDEASDHRWLEAAIEALGRADEDGRSDLRDVLDTIDQDYTVNARVRARIRAAIAGVPLRPELIERELTQDELASTILSVLAVCADYRNSFEKG